MAYSLYNCSGVNILNRQGAFQWCGVNGQQSQSGQECAGEKNQGREETNLSQQKIMFKYCPYKSCLRICTRISIGLRHTYMYKS